MQDNTKVNPENNNGGLSNHPSQNLQGNNSQIAEINPAEATTQSDILASNEAKSDTQPQIASDNINDPENIPSDIKPIEGQVVDIETKHAGGRPSKYSEDMLIKAKTYYQLCLNGETFINKEGKQVTRRKMPLLEELARLCEVDSETISNWANESEEIEYKTGHKENPIVKITQLKNQGFFDTIKRIKELQKERIILNGFSAKNPTFSIFMLKANHGMIETEKQVLVADRDVKVSITRE